jgi:DNA-binding response OmpR family regulator
MSTQLGKTYPQIGLLVPQCLTRQEVETLLASQASAVYVFPNLGELRQSAYLSQIDVLIVDLSGDVESKLRFMATISKARRAGLVALYPACGAQGESLRVRALESGADCCLALPVVPSELSEVVNRLWAGQKTAVGNTQVASSLINTAQRLAQNLN